MVEVVLGSLIAAVPMAVMANLLPQGAAGQLEPHLRPLLVERERERQVKKLQGWLQAVAREVSRNPTPEELAEIHALLGVEDVTLKLRDMGCLPAVLAPTKEQVHMGLEPVWVTATEKMVLQQYADNVSMYAQLLRYVMVRHPGREKAFGAA